MQKINFQDLPNTTTPINATNLNAIQTNAETAINETKPSTAINNVNLNDYTDFGFKYFGTGCTNAPDSYVYVQTITNGGDLTQIAYSVTDDRIWKRTGPLYNGVRTWGQWEKLITTRTLCYATFLSGNKELTQTTWTYTDLPLDATTDTFRTNNLDMFTAVSNGIRCNFNGVVQIERALATNHTSELDIKDAYGNAYNILGGTSHSFSVQSVQEGDIIKIQYITGASSFTCYGARLSVIRIG